jgi:hypothetical protein
MPRPTILNPEAVVPAARRTARAGNNSEAIDPPKVGYALLNEPILVRGNIMGQRGEVAKVGPACPAGVEHLVHPTDGVVGPEGWRRKEEAVEAVRGPSVGVPWTDCSHC